MARLSLSKAWDETKSVLGRIGAPIVAISLAFLVLPMTVFGTYSPETLMGMAPRKPMVSLIMLILMLVGLIGRLGIARIAIGPATTVGEALKHGLRRTPSAALAIMIFILPVALLSAPFILQILQNPTNPPAAASLIFLTIMLAAIAFGVRILGLVVPAAAAEDGGPIALMRRSWRLTAGNWWRLLGCILLIYVASWIAGWAAGAVLGAILAGIGGAIESMSLAALILAATLAIVGAVFSVLLTVMLARVYVQLAGASPAALSVPRTGT